MVVHGLIHIMGVVLLLEWGEPGDLTYAVAWPEPGTALAVLFAAVWGLSTILFFAAGYQLLSRGRWSWLAVAAAAVSLLAVGPMVAAAPLGAVLSVLILGAALWNLTRRPRHR